MKKFVCIVCPNGCRLKIDEDTLEVTGNMCPRGDKYAKDEITNPKRSLTTSVKTTLEGYPVVSVRTDGDLPKDKIFEAMKVINEFVLTEKVSIGSVLIPNILGTDVNIILTTNIM